MAVPTASSGTVAPGSQTPVQASNAKKRQSQIDAARRKVQSGLDSENSKAQAAARKKKGIQNYDKKSIQGESDFGVGNAGPGIPYSVRSTKTSELGAPKPGKPSTPTAQVPKPGGVQGLWPTTGNVDKTKNPNWKLLAIRRRLNNG